MAEYKKRFLKLSKFCPYMILDDDRKKRRFLDRLNNVIASGISGATHSTFQSLRDTTIEVESQRLIQGSKQRSYESFTQTLLVRALQREETLAQDLQTMIGSKSIDLVRVSNQVRGVIVRGDLVSRL